jgi:transposase
VLAPVQLSDADRAELERRAGSPDVRERDRLRAQVVLLAAEGLTNREISRRIGLRPEHVGVWRHRYVTYGLAGLDDRERHGRPPVYGSDVRKLIRWTICQIAGNPTLDWWTYRAVAAALPSEYGISISQVRRICMDMGLEQGVPAYFLDQEATNGTAEIPLFVEPEPPEPGSADPWPGASADR